MDVHLISARDVYVYFREGTLLVDMRDEAAFEKWHLPGAVCVPYEEDYKQWRAALPEFRAVILYCDRGNNSLYEENGGGGRYRLCGGRRSRGSEKSLKNN